MGRARGTGHITLLALRPLTAPEGAPAERQYYMIEAEVITGPPFLDDREVIELSYFAYYYGVAAVVPSGAGWRIAGLEYYPEGFLCAPYHGWSFDADAILGIVYHDNLKLIDHVTGRTERDGLTQITATGPEGTYRFDFVRLTNGWDLLIGEFRQTQGQWIPAELLDGRWPGIKLRR